MSLFRLDASIRAEGSVSRAVADIVEASWRDGSPDGDVTRRSIGLAPLASDAWGHALSSKGLEQSEWSDAQRDAVALATTLADELLGATSFLFAMPLYNFGISQHFKTWLDLVMTDSRFATGARPLAGRDAVLVVARGGAYGSGTPREGWDHATGWVRRILDDVWGMVLHVVETEFTLVGVNPALDQFKEQAARMRREAESLAAEYGAQLDRAEDRSLAAG